MLPDGISNKTELTGGTSFMAPQVSGALALVAQAFPEQTPAQWMQDC